MQYPHYSNHERHDIEYLNSTKSKRCSVTSSACKLLFTIQLVSSSFHTSSAFSTSPMKCRKQGTNTVSRQKYINSKISETSTTLIRGLAPTSNKDKHNPCPHTIQEHLEQQDGTTYQTTNIHPTNTVIYTPSFTDSITPSIFDFLFSEDGSNSNNNIMTARRVTGPDTTNDLMTRMVNSTDTNGNAKHGDYESQKREFEMKLGKAIDTLRKDYPKILLNNPDFTIYDPHIEVLDPSGFTIHNIKNYKTSFNFLHALIHFFYCPENSLLTFRLFYDSSRRNIRVSWNAHMTPRAIYGGIRNQLHVDGISVYELDRYSGLITQHRVEHLLVNDSPVTAPQGIFHALAKEAQSYPIPVWNFKDSHHDSNTQNLFTFEFKPSLSLFKTQSSLLFSSPSSSASTSYDDEFENHPLFNPTAYEKKNASRKKFGLPPISPSEFIEIEQLVQQQALAQREKATQLSNSIAEMANKQSKRNNNMFNKLFGNVMKDTCQSNWDCERPEVCCDLGFKKMCCKSGMKVFNGVPPQMQPIRVPVVVDNGEQGGMRRGGPGGMNDY